MTYIYKIWRVRTVFARSKELLSSILSLFYLLYLSHLKEMYICFDKRYLYKPFSYETWPAVTCQPLSKFCRVTWVCFWTICFKNFIISSHLEKLLYKNRIWLNNTSLRIACLLKQWVHFSWWIIRKTLRLSLIDLSFRSFNWFMRCEFF